MFASDSNSPVEEHELRQMLLELGVEFDDARLPRMLAAVQPIRGKLRSESAGQRRALLRGAAITAGGGPPGQLRVAPGLAEEPEEAEPTLGNLLSRLVAIFFAFVAGSFTLITWGTWPVSLPLACMTGLLLFAGITGRGSANLSLRRPSREASPRQSRESPPPRTRSLVGTLVAIVLIYVTGIGNFLVFAVTSVFDPRFHAEGDFFSRVFQVVGLIVIFVVVSHVIRARRR